MTDLADEDPYLWLEEVRGERALAWVRAENARAEALLTARPEYGPTRAAALAVLTAKDRIPHVTRRGAWLYNLWQDEENPRGLWRRTTLEEYERAAPTWETVLDLDALGKAEGESWVWGGAVSLGPEYRHALVKLSRGGSDAVVVREFDLVARRFVPAAEGGFVLPAAKSDVSWRDADTLYVGTDFGPGSLTESGYPRVVKRWRRGTPLAEATSVFEGEHGDVAVAIGVDRTPGFERTVCVRSLDFYRSREFLLLGDELRELAKPLDAGLSFVREWALLELKSDLRVGARTYPRGALLAARAEDLVSGRALAGTAPLHVLFEPTPTRTLAGTAATRSTLLLTILENVASRVEERRFDGTAWRARAVALPGAGTVALQALHDPLLLDDPLAERYFLHYTDFLTPDSLLTGTSGSDEHATVKARSRHFDAGGMHSEQRFATSPDGTRVPYFVVWPRGARADGTNPTLLYGYGGFEVSLQPWYSGTFGRAWFERGGVLVVANIRGGGEYGPGWHQAALRANRQRSFDDFLAVAEDLVKRGVTRPERLGIMGGSNGGLLVGACLVQRPELFGAVVCSVPLLDMQRYPKLLAGASWLAEYGDPELPAEWESIRRWSPYHNVRAGVRYPEVLFSTSTADDRVHPGHARKMAARMQALGHTVLYHENLEGGHGGAADHEQMAHKLALEFAYLWRALGGSARLPPRPPG